MERLEESTPIEGTERLTRMVRGITQLPQEKKINRL